MVPEIKIADIQQGISIIYVGETESQFEIIDLNDDEKDYLKKRFDLKKNVVTINRFRYQLICVKIKEEKTPFLVQESARQSGHLSYKYLRTFNLEHVGVKYIGSNNVNILAFLEGLVLSAYQFNKYKKKEEDENYSLKIIEADIERSLQKELEQIYNVSTAVYYARNLVNEPVSYLNAEKLAEEIKQMALEAGADVEIFQKKKIESLRMGGLLAVNRGSVDPPTFTIIEWKPQHAVNKKPVVLIGKGLVYDTGGLSLKPTANSMDEMKCDTAGSAAVSGAIYAVAKNKLPVHIVALVPSTDNRPGGNAYAPGDIITMHNGSTVEVLNTDAEGRMILADAISYADHYDPMLIITVATLTGSAQMAIGQDALVGMGNAEQEMLNNVITAGDETHERVVQFPFWDEYADELKSEVADMKNIGGRMAGAITAGKFLEKFAKQPFIHLDIAGPAFLKKNISYRPVGGTGIGVRLLYRFISNMCNS